MSNTININGQAVNIEDIKAALQTQGLDIKELAKQAKALKNGEIKPPEKQNGVSSTTYQLALVNYPDFCIERKTAKTRQLIVIMPSCKGYYVKSFKGEDELIEELTPELYAKLTSGMNDINLPDGFWLYKVRSGKKFYENLCKVLRSETYVEMIKHKVAPKFEDIHWDRWTNVESNSYIAAYKNQPTLYREFFNTNKAKKVLIDDKKFINDLVNDFGLNNARDFLTQLELSLIEVGPSYYGSSFSRNRFGKVYPDMEMKYESFRDYVLYQSVFMGYGRTMKTFFNEWYDSIEMQKNIYRKIKEKYHDNLPLWHHQLSYKSSCMQEFIDENKMQSMVELAELYQGVCGKYVFIAPTCKQDFLDEAQMQQNCLASYISRFIDGDCIIMFMRLKDDPTNSLVTIEIRKDDNGDYTVINQKYQARNRYCTDEQSDAIDKWIKRAVNRVKKKKNGGVVDADDELSQILEAIKQ